MRALRPVCLFFLLLLPSLVTGQDPPTRDRRAVAVLQQSFAAMGGVVPADSVVQGSIVTTAGSATDEGTVRILTRGLDQTLEEIRTRETQSLITYSRGHAGRREEGATKPLNLERASSSFSPNSPIVVIAAALDHSDTAAEYLGTEKVGDATLLHIRFWNTHASKPRLRHLAEFTKRDLWVDASTMLPVKLAYEFRVAGGAAPRAQVEVIYSDYRSIQGLLYPYRVERSFNGTPWAVITIESVALNTGQLSDADFRVR